MKKLTPLLLNASKKNNHKKHKSKNVMLPNFQ